MEILKTISDYVIVFAVGGAFCAIAQLLIVKTKLTPARILVIFLVAGIVLEGVGAFKYMKEFAKAGATLPIIGFGASLARGAIEGALSNGVIGAFAGGLTLTAAGVAVAIIASFAVALIFSPKSK